MAQPKYSVIAKTQDGDIEMNGRACELSAYSFIPTQRNTSADRTYFNSANSASRERYKSSTYDRLFNQDYGFNNKLHRCDREHAKSRGLTVNTEEASKVVPTLASSVYGHTVQTELDPPDRKHVRIALVKAEFYRRNQQQHTDSGH